MWCYTEIKFKKKSCPIMWCRPKLMSHPPDMNVSMNVLSVLDKISHSVKPACAAEECTPFILLSEQMLPRLIQSWILDFDKYTNIIYSPVNCNNRTCTQRATTLPSPLLDSWKTTDFPSSTPSRLWHKSTIYHKNVTSRQMHVWD